MKILDSYLEKKEYDLIITIGAYKRYAKLEDLQDYLLEHDFRTCDADGREYTSKSGRIRVEFYYGECAPWPDTSFFYLVKDESDCDVIFGLVKELVDSMSEKQEYSKVVYSDEGFYIKKEEMSYVEYVINKTVDAIRRKDFYKRDSDKDIENLGGFFDSDSEALEGCKEGNRKMIEALEDRISKIKEKGV